MSGQDQFGMEGPERTSMPSHDGSAGTVGVPRCMDHWFLQGEGRRAHLWQNLTDEICHVGIIVLAGNIVQQTQLAEVQLLQGTLSSVSESAGCVYARRGMG